LSSPVLDVPLSIGLFDQVEWEDRPASEVFDEHLELIEYADSSGFHAYHLSEHHASPLSLTPSPNIILAAATQRTKNIRLGALVYTLPYYNPLRLADEINMLDHLSHGRLELGVGRGISALEASFFGINTIEDSRGIYRENFDAILAAFTADEKFSFQGQYHSYTDVPLWVHPVQRPYPPLWFPSSNEESIGFTAGQGLNTVLNNYFTRAVTRTLVDKYAEVFNEHKDDPTRLNAHVALPKVGWSVRVVVAPTDKEAEATARQAFATWEGHITHLERAAGAPPRADRGGYDHHRTNGSLLVGSPERVAEEMHTTVDVTGVNYLLGSFAFGALPHASVMQSMELFAERVMPDFVEAKA
jgi:alkanesulfonate monooxygenase SsuD/methylene tetrahydromethanopterin reductase-like flavin-dependent oxidoreductase (luciferase family)